MTLDKNECRAWAYLSRVAEVPCAGLTALVDDQGPVDVAAMIRRGKEPEHLRAKVTARRECDYADHDLAVLDRMGGRLITPDDEEWPYLSFAGFGNEEMAKREYSAPPMVLWAVGPAHLDVVAERSAALVGTRAATSYGEHVTAELAAGLVERDAAVISGGAYGIDGAAHRAALASGGVTVAVLASGIDVPYPSGHSALLRRVSETGLMLSEYPPGERPTRYRFLTRNRLVAALSRATVVVEAALRSGAANTAAWATAMGRPLGAVPGPVTSAASAGCHVLLRDNRTTLVDRADQIIELIGRMGELAEEPEHPVTPLDGLSPEQRRVYEALPARGWLNLEQIAIGSALASERALGPLALLELSGLVEKRDGRWRIGRG
jgi:DNA processing protein